MFLLCLLVYVSSVFRAVCHVSHVCVFRVVKLVLSCLRPFLVPVLLCRVWCSMFSAFSRTSSVAFRLICPRVFSLPSLSSCVFKAPVSLCSVSGCLFNCSHVYGFLVSSCSCSSSCLCSWYAPVQVYVYVFAIVFMFSSRFFQFSLAFGLCLSLLLSFWFLGYTTSLNKQLTFCYPLVLSSIRLLLEPLLKHIGPPGLKHLVNTGRTNTHLIGRNLWQSKTWQNSNLKI